MAEANDLLELERVRSLIVAGRLGDATEIAHALTTRHPADARTWRLLGSVHARTGRLQEAIQCIQRAIALLPADPGLHLQYGQYLLAMGNRREALEVAGKVAAMQPSGATWNDALGTLFTYCEEPRVHSLSSSVP